MKTAIIILSDPSAGEEALGRVFNALAAGYDFATKDVEVTIQFAGTGSRWIAELTNPEHPAHSLFQEVKDHVAGVSKGCAAVFDSEESVEKSGFDFLTENNVPGTPGLTSLANLHADGFNILIF